MEQRKEKAVMTEQHTQHEDEPRNAFRGHSLAGAAVCLGIGITIALLAILGQPG
jgi:hypothetical protein